MMMKQTPVYIWHKAIPCYEERMKQLSIHCLWALTGNDNEVNSWELV
jgi:hypothetical protein